MDVEIQTFKLKLTFLGETSFSVTLETALNRKQDAQIVKSLPISVIFPTFTRNNHKYFKNAKTKEVVLKSMGKLNLQN